jgi:hypothetical protein
MTKRLKSAGRLAQKRHTKHKASAAWSWSSHRIKIITHQAQNKNKKGSKSGLDGPKEASKRSEVKKSTRIKISDPFKKGEGGASSIDLEATKRDKRRRCT